jgi:hypothetical protein
MKLKHSKSWYERKSKLEGDSEVGAGIPPGAGGRVFVPTRLRYVTGRGASHGGALPPARSAAVRSGRQAVA